MERAADPGGAHRRMTALVGAVLLAAVLPQAAASAGPAPAAAAVRPPARTAVSAAPEPAAPGVPEPEVPAVPESAAPGVPESGSPDGARHRDRGLDPAAAGAGWLPPAVLRKGALHAADQGRVISMCGPELTGREGVEAQTCVLREGRELWGRTYYRSAAGRAPSVVLTLMRPDGRTVQVRCSGEAGNADGVCQTRRAPVREPVDQGLPYGAVAELVSSDGERLLLRSGSNSPVGADRWASGAARPGEPADAGHGNARSLATGDAPATGLQEP
ncbi:hypothetical protein ABT112_13555 [Streptomyces sp. NPDC002055]|uniref:hypothetical protein n=1 Tax=Streptomyces sp. NPDC002055 TaxID=3154534 RepID=UPI00332457F5